MLLFGPGYCGRRVAEALVARGWEVRCIGRAGGADLGWPTHILSTVPPQKLLPGTGRGTAREAGGGGGSRPDAALVESPLHHASHGPPPRTGEDFADPILNSHNLADSSARWFGYLSSTGVYGDAGGAWVDETAPLRGRRGGRIEADLAWQQLGARVLRLPGIYGPGRSPLERAASGQAHRVDVPGQVFSRVHVDDIVAGVLAAIERGPPGAYNLADDLPASQNDVAEYAAALLGLPPPPFLPLEALSPAARAFYAENRRVASGKARRLLGWRPRYPDFRAGLRALMATSSPAKTSTPPAAAVGVQR